MNYGTWSNIDSSRSGISTNETNARFLAAGYNTAPRCVVNHVETVSNYVAPPFEQLVILRGL